MSISSDGLQMRRAVLAINNDFVTEDGEQAVAKFIHNRPRLMILDLLLPKMSGFEVMAALKQLPAEQQIVIKLKFIEDLDNPTISDMLHKSEGSIRVVQHRAITKLREIIKQRINK